MNRLPTAKRVAVVAALVEGNSIRATARMTNVSKPTILKLLAQLGDVCTQFHDQAVRGLRSKRIECDEIWQFCYAKQKNVPESKRGTFGFGDVWTWTALDSNSKLIVSWRGSARCGYGVRVHDGRSEPHQDARPAHDGRTPRLCERG